MTATGYLDILTKVITQEILLQKLDEIENEMRSSGHWAAARSIDLPWWLPVLEYFQFEKIPADRQLLAKGKLPLYHGQWVYDIRHDCLRTPSLRRWVELALAYNDILPCENEIQEKLKRFDRDFQSKNPLQFVDALTDSEITQLEQNLTNVEQALRRNGGWDERDFWPTEPDIPETTKLLQKLQYDYIPKHKQLLKLRQLPRPSQSLERDLRATFHRDFRWNDLRQALQEYQEWLREQPANSKEIKNDWESFVDSNYIISSTIEAGDMHLVFQKARELSSSKISTKKDDYFRDEITSAQTIDNLVLAEIARTFAKTALEKHFSFTYPYAFAEFKSDQDPEDNVAFTFQVVANKTSIDSFLEMQKKK